MKHIINLLLLFLTLYTSKVSSYYYFNLIDYTRELSSYGGSFYAYGEFGYDFQGLSFYIGSNRVNITYIDSIQLQGTIIGGYGFEALNVYYGPDNVYSAWDGFYYNSSLCLNNCNYNGECYYGECYCYYQYHGIDCSEYGDQSSSSYNDGSNSYSPKEISCDTSQSYIRVDSYESINCTASGIVECYDNIGGSVCMGNNYEGSTTCLTNSYFNNGDNSMSCYGNHIVCQTSNVKCRVDSYGSLFVNNKISKIRSITLGKETVDLMVLDEINDFKLSPSSSSSSKLHHLIIYSSLIIIVLLLLL